MAENTALLDYQQSEIDQILQEVMNTAPEGSREKQEVKTELERTDGKSDSESKPKSRTKESRLSEYCTLYQELLQQKEQLEKKLETLKPKIIRNIGVGNSFTCGKYIFTAVASSKSSRFNTKLFRAENEELYEQYRVESQNSESLRVRKKGR